MRAGTRLSAGASLVLGTQGGLPRDGREPALLASFHRPPCGGRRVAEAAYTQITLVSTPMLLMLLVTLKLRRYWKRPCRSARSLGCSGRHCHSRSCPLGPRGCRGGLRLPLPSLAGARRRLTVRPESSLEARVTTRGVSRPVGPPRVSLRVTESPRLTRLGKTGGSLSGRGIRTRAHVLAAHQSPGHDGRDHRRKRLQY